MKLILTFVYIFLFLSIIYIIFKLVRRILLNINSHFGLKISLKDRIKAKADRKFYKLLNKFKQEHHRNPNKNELFRIIINASHITIRGISNKGHWGRQKVRKYLLEKHKVVENYVMR